MRQFVYTLLVSHCSPLLHCVRLTLSSHYFASSYAQKTTQPNPSTLLIGSSVPASASLVNRPCPSPPLEIYACPVSITSSSFAMCITIIKFVVPAWRLYYECTHNPKPISDQMSIRELKLWLDTGMSAIFVILSGLLLVFSFVGRGFIDHLPGWLPHPF